MIQLDEIFLKIASEEETIQYYESGGIKSRRLYDEDGNLQESVEYYDCGEVKSKVN